MEMNVIAATNKKSFTKFQKMNVTRHVREFQETRIVEDLGESACTVEPVTSKLTQLRKVKILGLATFPSQFGLKVVKFF